MADRKLHWEKVYANRPPPELSWYQNVPALSLQLIRNSGIALDAPILDVGCGASLLVDFLCNEGYTNISVLDISSKALEQSRGRLAERACEVDWIEGDITRFDPPKPFSLWHDRAVFHFLTDASDRVRYVEVLKQALPTGGCLVLAAFAIDGPVKCSGLDVVQYDAEKLLLELGEEFELVEELSEKHLTPANREQSFAYFRFFRR